MTPIRVSTRLIADNMGRFGSCAALRVRALIVHNA
jgi:hypothetical protein